MTEDLKNMLRTIVNRQIHRTDATIAILEKELGTVPTSIRNSIHESSITLEAAFDLIIETIDADTKLEQNPESVQTTTAETNQEKGALVSQEEIESISYSTNVEEGEFIPTLSIEELRERNASPSFAEALANAAGEPIEPAPIEIIEPKTVQQEPPTEKTIAPEPMPEETPVQQAEPVDTTPHELPDLTEEFEEEEQELSAFERMRMELDKYGDEDED